MPSTRRKAEVVLNCLHLLACNDEVNSLHAIGCSSWRSRVFQPLALRSYRWLTQHLTCTASPVGAAAHLMASLRFTLPWQRSRNSHRSTSTACHRRHVRPLLALSYHTSHLCTSCRTYMSGFK